MDFNHIERIAYITGDVKNAVLFAQLADLDAESDAFPDTLADAQIASYEEGKHAGENADLAETIRVKDAEIEELQRVNTALTSHFKVIFAWFTQNELKTAPMRKLCADKLRQSVRQFSIWL